MTERDALLAAILSSPGDDTPRLIYADWCEENGEVERAEFIRVQCEIASRENERDRCITCVRPGEQHHNGPCRSPLKGIMHRARELFGQAWKWIPEPLGKLEWGIERYGMNTRHFIDADADRNLDLCWRRGFVAELQCSWADFLRHHAAMIWRTGEPFRSSFQPIEHVRFLDTPEIDWFDSDMQLAWIPGTCFGPWDVDDLNIEDGESVAHGVLKKSWPSVTSWSWSIQ